MSRLICFDVDGTLLDIPDYIWSILNKRFNNEIRDGNLKKEHLKGRISYDEWVQKDFEVYIRNGANYPTLMNAIKNYTLIDGTIETLDALKRKSKKLSIISGGLDLTIKKFNLEHYFDYIFMNLIEFDEDGNIIKIKATPYDEEKKVDGVLYIIGQERIKLPDCVFIGDNDNDYHVCKFLREHGGLSIAFNSKSERLNNVCNHTITKKDLRAILRYLG